METAVAAGALIAVFLFAGLAILFIYRKTGGKHDGTGLRLLHYDPLATDHPEEMKTKLQAWRSRGAAPGPDPRNLYASDGSKDGPLGVLSNFCSCSRLQANAQQGAARMQQAIKGRLPRRPVTQKLQRSAGASRAEPRIVDFSKADPSKWVFEEKTYSGAYSYVVEPTLDKVTGPISEGLAKVKANPTSYDGMYYQADMTSWPSDQQKYTLVKRTGSGYKVATAPGGAFMYVEAKYQVLDPNVPIVPDKHTDRITFKGQKLGPPLPPGRSKGIADVPNIKIIGDVDPSDVSQGSVGDCWLLSAISAVAEYDGAIAKVFRKTPGLSSMPQSNKSNTYIVTLYDLTTWQPVDIELDERLCTKADESLLGCQPSVDGELWVSYLEKACAIHCGGWDKIDGGQCTHAWRLLTGCKYQYTIRNDGEGFQAFSALNPNTGEWEKLANSPHDGFQGLWPSVWPTCGGGGDYSMKLTDVQLFERMCAWDDTHYLMGAGTKSGSDSADTDGIVDGHAYTILQCIDNAGGTEWDMIKVRNPWGKGEFSKGQWTDDGPGWKQFPQVKEACQPVQANDGVFWVDRQEFFKYFKTIYLCAHDMSEFLKA